MKVVRYWLGAVETVLALALAWVLVFVVPFRWTARWFGGTGKPSDQARTTDFEKRWANYITRRLRRVADHMPWKTTCLVRAVAGSLMLKRRGVPSTIRFGVTKKDGEIAAHAWLIVGDITVLGGEIASEFQALADMGGKAG